MPVEGVSPPDPDWAPDFPSADAFRKGVQMLRGAGVEIAAYAHLRNISRQCCTCCGNLTQFASWVDLVDEQKLLRAQVSRVLGALTRQKTGRAWRKWMSVMDMLERQRVKARKQQR